MRSNPASPTDARRGLRFAIGLCCALTIGCGMFDRIAPRHGWNDRWGTLVPHNSFPADCSLCHKSESWDVMVEGFFFDHQQETGYKLEGSHRQAACLRCHNDRGPVEAYTARGCGGCHVDPHKSALSLDCTTCHNEYTWQPDGMVAEHNRTRFPLVASHAFAACESCHERATVGDFRGAPVECHLCHQQEAFLATINHVVNGWQVGCEDCHDVSDWRPVNFNHALFPLLGGHNGLNCTDCHAGGRIVGTPNDCFSCHRQDYLNTVDHVAQNFSTDCTECHTIFDWTVP